MTFWNFDIAAGRFFLDFAWLGLLLVMALILRNRIPFFQKFLIPANLLAGVLGLLFAGNGMEWIDLTSERLGVYVYHLLALLFIGLGLRSPQKKIGLSSVKTGILFICTYLIQGLIGLAITFCLIFTIMPDLFAGIGLLPPLAFGMNPGIAYTIGQNWEAHGFTSGGIAGLTFAAAGFLAAYTTGIWMVKKGILEGKAAYYKKSKIPGQHVHSKIPEDLDIQPAGRITTSSGVLESLSLHIGLIGIVYLMTYGLLQFMDFTLSTFGASNEAETLWSFHFVFAAICALIARQIIDASGTSKRVDDVTMTRLSNLFMDLMIAASIAAISFAVIGQYWIPLLIISIAVAASTWWMLTRLCTLLFSDYQLERTAAIYGNMTGTLQSGLLLLRILDEKMESPVSYNLVYGSGLALILGFPLLLLINAPVHYFADITTGFGAVFLAMAVYLVLLLIALFYLNGERIQNS